MDKINFSAVWTNKNGQWSIKVFTVADKVKFKETVEAAISNIFGGDSFDIRKTPKGYSVSFPEYYANKKDDIKYRKKLSDFLRYLENELNESVKIDLRKMIREELKESKSHWKRRQIHESAGKYQLIIDFESEEQLRDIVRDLNDSLKDSYFYSNDFPGRVISTKVRKR